MTQEQRIVTHREQTVTSDRSGAPEVSSHREVTYRTSASTMLQRIVIFVFALIQGLLVLRILLLLMAAREGNDLVSFTYGLSEVFVAPFRGILRQEVIAAGQTALDVTAIVAIVGWTVVELVLLGLIRIFRGSPY